MIFTDNAFPDPKIAYEFTGIGKSVNLLESGSFSGSTPDWVGTWDVNSPSNGYFEMFIDEQIGSHVSGRIEDMLGTSTFEGDITLRSISFVKRYTDCARQASNSPINYQANTESDRNRHQGIYRGDKAVGWFYMEKPVGNSPFQMSMSWFDLNEADNARQIVLF